RRRAFVEHELGLARPLGHDAAEHVLAAPEVEDRLFELGTVVTGANWFEHSENQVEKRPVSVRDFKGLAQPGRPRRRGASAASARPDRRNAAPRAIARRSAQ